MLHIWPCLPLVTRSEDVQRVRVGVCLCPDDLRGLVVRIVPRFVSYFFVINPPEIKIVRLSALVAFPVARSEPIFLSFSGNSLSRFVWWRHVFTEKQRITARSG